jgi:hypothetical protein
VTHQLFDLHNIKTGISQPCAKRVSIHEPAKPLNQKFARHPLRSQSDRALAYRSANEVARNYVKSVSLKYLQFPEILIDTTFK